LITHEVSNARVMAGKQHLKLTLSTNLSVQALCALKYNLGILNTGSQ